MITAEEVQAAGVVVAAAALAVNSAFLWARYQHDKASRNISASMKLVEEWRSLGGRKARASIRQNLSGVNKPSASGGISGLKDDLRDDVKTVAYLCDEIGARVIYGEADPMLINAFLGHSITKTWNVLEPYILAERKIYNFPLFQSHFEALAKKTSAKKIDKNTRTRIRRHVGFFVYRTLTFNKGNRTPEEKPGNSFPATLTPVEQVKTTGLNPIADTPPSDART
jgi:hypothetical protein